MVNGRKLLLLLQVSLVPPGCADELGVGGGGGGKAGKIAAGNGTEYGVGYS